MPATGTLPPEIWLEVFRKLLRPIPLPLSRPARSALGHDSGLLAVARTCKLFHSLSTPLIYRAVVTDRLPLFLRNHNNLARQRQLAHTEHLFIEYPPKVPSITYEQLMASKHMAVFWSSLDSLEYFAEGAEMIQFMGCQVEIQELCSIMSDVATYGTGKLLPKMTQIAVSSIYGPDTSRLWLRYNEKSMAHGGGSWHTLRTVQYWEEFLASSNVRYCCIRGSGAPLTLKGAAPPPRPWDTVPEFTLHIAGEDQQFTVRQGGVIRWVSDEPSHTPWQKLFQRLMSPFQDIPPGVPGTAGASTEDEAFHMDIFCSTAVLGKRWKGIPGDLPFETLIADIPGVKAKRLTVATQRAIADRLSTHYQAALRRETGLHNKLNWRASADSPTCKVCGSGPPVE